MWSTPNAAAVLMIDPRLKGWLTDSSSRQTVACVARRQDLFSRLTSVGPSCLATPGLLTDGGGSSRSGYLQHPVAGPGRYPLGVPPGPGQPLVQRAAPASPTAARAAPACLS